MKNTAKTITTIITIAGFSVAQAYAYGAGTVDHISTSSIAASAVTANSSSSTASVTVYNCTTDEPIQIVAPTRGSKSQL
jgi:hypothetical protein